MDGCDTLPRPAVLVSAGVDYLTATCYRTSGNEPFKLLGERLVAEQADIGHEVLSWKASQYHGVRTEGIIRGVRFDTHIIRLSSELAHDNWKEVYDLATNVTRIDCEMTFKFDERHPTFFRENETLALAHRGGRGRRKEVELRCSRTTGDRLNLGRRQSEVYARCYDKGMEQRCALAGLLIRQELEFKGDRASQVAAHLAQSKSEATDALDMVSQYFRASGVQTMWNDGKFAMAARGTERQKPRKLRWLEQAVKPSVLRLLEAGKLIEVLEALGLSEKVIVKRDSPVTLKTK